MTLGEFVKQYREAHFMSQREFARRCGLSNAQISLIEKGIGTDGKPFTPTGLTLSKVARGMGLPVESLIAQCDDFLIDTTDAGFSETPQVLQFIEDQSKRSPDEEMLLQAYRLIPVEHRIEAMYAVLQIKDKYEK